MLDRTEKLYTYQELSARFQVHPKTVSRWFRRYHKFRPTKNTARVPETAVQMFMQNRKNWSA